MSCISRSWQNFELIIPGFGLTGGIAAFALASIQPFIVNVVISVFTSVIVASSDIIFLGRVALDLRDRICTVLLIAGPVIFSSIAGFMGFFPSVVWGVALAVSSLILSTIFFYYSTLHQLNLNFS